MYDDIVILTLSEANGEESPYFARSAIHYTITKSGNRIQKYTLIPRRRGELMRKNIQQSTPAIHAVALTKEPAERLVKKLSKAV